MIEREARNNLSLVSTVKYFLFGKINVRDALILADNLNIDLTTVLTPSWSIKKYIIPFGKKRLNIL